MSIFHLRIGTRGSTLAVIQAESVADSIRNIDANYASAGAIEIIKIKASGDFDHTCQHDMHLRDSGGKGLFTKELEEALLQNQIDIAVHSLKDVPTWPPKKLALVGVLPRLDPREAFLSNKSSRFLDLPQGAVVGTSSLRRQAQILALRPDIKVIVFRGNVDTRLAKLEAGVADATFLAACGLMRMGLEKKITEYVPVQTILPAACQGIVAIEARGDDDRVSHLISKISCQTTYDVCLAERAFLEALDGSCHTPIAALARIEDTQIYLNGLVAHPEGKGVWRLNAHDIRQNAVQLGHELGRQLRQIIPSGILPE